MLPLCDSTLPTLARRIEVPTYDRASLRASIVHIGVGSFHRAHQAVYLDELACAGLTDWGVTGVSLRTRWLQEALTKQDGLFSVVERECGVDRARIVGVMGEYLYSPDDPRAVVDRLAGPETRIVTLTVTGDGYGPQASWTDPLISALARRRVAGLGGFTVLSCDNLADSGAAACRALLERAAERDETLARWIFRNVTFPDTMVDRITPGTDDALRVHLATSFGVHDRAPVAAEPFRQWVVQDAFCQGRPPLEDVGVQVVSDVTPYKLIKTRLLNGTHTAIAYLGWLAGFRMTAELTENATLRAFITELMRREIAPHLPSVPDMDLEDYMDSVLGRLSNGSVADPLERLCRRGSTKVPAYLVPPLADAARAGRPAPLLSLALAGWFQYLRGTDLHGRPIAIEDDRRDDLQRLALRGGTDPLPLLGTSGLFGSLGNDPRVRHQVRGALRDLQHGVEPAISRRLARADRAVALVIPRQSRSVEHEGGLIS